MKRFIIFKEGTNKLIEKLTDRTLLDDLKFKTLPEIKGCRVVMYEDFRFSKRKVLEDRTLAKECLVLSDDYLNGRVIIYHRKHIKEKNGTRLIHDTSYYDLEERRHREPVFNMRVFKHVRGEGILDYCSYQKKKFLYHFEDDNDYGEDYKWAVNQVKWMTTNKFIKNILKGYYRN